MSIKTLLKKKVAVKVLSVLIATVLALPVQIFADYAGVTPTTLTGLTPVYSLGTAQTGTPEETDKTRAVYTYNDGTIYYQLASAVLGDSSSYNNGRYYLTAGTTDPTFNFLGTDYTIHPNPSINNYTSGYALELKNEDYIISGLTTKTANQLYYGLDDSNTAGNVKIDIVGNILSENNQYNYVTIDDYRDINVTSNILGNSTKSSGSMNDGIIMFIAGKDVTFNGNVINNTFTADTGVSVQGFTRLFGDNVTLQGDFIGNKISVTKSYYSYTRGGAARIETANDSTKNSIVNVKGIFSNNLASTKYAFGSAIYIQGQHYTDNGNGTTINIQDGSIFSGNSIDAAESSEGGAIYIDVAKQLNLGNVQFVKNEAITENSYSGSGGALYLYGIKDINIDGTIFAQNSASKYGGALNIAQNNAYEGRTIDIANTIFKGNSANLGAGLYTAYSSVSAIMNITDTKFDSNTATNYAAGAYIEGSFTVNITGTTVDDMVFSSNQVNNTSSYNNVNGGALYLSVEGDVTIDKTKFDSNTLSSNNWAYGGALFSYVSSENQDYVISNSLFTSNDLNWDGYQYSYGGAIYLDIRDYDNETVTLTGNTFSSNKSQYGGALAIGHYSANDGIIAKINGTTSFSENIAKQQGGAIYLENGQNNETEIDGVTFTGNKAESADNYVAGGAILSKGGTLKVKNSTFTNNKANMTGSGTPYYSASGGAINVSGQLQLEDSSFTSNSATSASSGEGGAINIRHDGTQHISTISDTTFTTNSASDYGGAIYYYGLNSISDDSLTIKDSTFTGNTAGVEGGALYLRNSSDGSVTIDNVTFENNVAGTDSETGYTHGGAIHSQGIDKLTIKNSTFTGNNVKGTNAFGGAIYAENTLLEIIDTNFSNNIAASDGAAITTSGSKDIIIKAVNSDVLFSNNGDGTLDNSGIRTDSNTLYLSASAGHSLTINDSMFLGGQRMYINGNDTDGSTGTGIVSLGGKITSGRKVTMYGGTLKVTSTDSSATNFLGGQIYAKENTTLDVQNNVVNTINISELGTDEGKTLSLKLDFDADSGNSDNLNFSYFISEKSLTTKLDLTNLNVIADGEVDGTDKYYYIYHSNLLDSNIGESTITSAVTSGGWQYSFVKGLDSSGAYYTATRESAYTLPEMIADSTKPNIYSLTTDIVKFDTGLGTLVGADRNFTINLNNKTLSGINKTDGTTKQAGITTVAGQTLNVNTGTMSGYTTAITNAGTANINGVTFNDNSTADITNTGTLNFSGDNTINKGITGAGTTNVTAGTTTIADTSAGITQTALNIANGATVSTNAEKLVITNNILNAGTVSLTGGTLTKSINGAGITEINGDVTINALMGNKIKVNEEKSLTISADNIDNPVVNNGTLNLGAGTLAEIISGTGTLNIGDGTNTILVTDSKLINQKNLNVLANATLQTTGAVVLEDGTGLINNGTITLTGADVSALYGNNKILNNGTFTADATSKVIAAYIENTSNMQIDSADNIVSANAITNTGTITLGSGTLKSSITGSGTTEINGDVSISENKTIANNVTVNSGKTLTTNISNLTGTITNNGTFKVTGDISKDIAGTGTTVLQTDTNILNADRTISGTLDMNGYKVNMAETTAPFEYKTLTVNQLKGNGTFSINADMAKNGSVATASDKIHVNNGADGSATLNLTNIKVTNPTATSDRGEYDNYVTYADGTLTGITLQLNGSTESSSIYQTSDGTNLYKFSLGSTTGALKAVIEEIPVSLGEYITGSTEYAKALDSYNVNSNLAVDSTLGETAEGDTRTGGKTLQVNISNGATLSATGTKEIDGITVANGYTLNLDGSHTSGATMSNFNTALTNNGTLNIKGMALTGNTVDINNNSTANFSGTNSIGSGITGEGDIHINDGTTTATASIESNQITIKSGAKLNSNNTITANNIINVGTLELNGATVSSNVTGAGTVSVIENSTISEGKNIINNISIADNKTLTNNGTINTTLNLGATQTIAGTGTLNLLDTSSNAGTVTQNTLTTASTLTNTGTITVANLLGNGTVENNNNLTITEYYAYNNTSITGTGTLNTKFIQINSDKTLTQSTVNTKGYRILSNGKIAGNVTVEDMVGAYSSNEGTIDGNVIVNANDSNTWVTNNGTITGTVTLNSGACTLYIGDNSNIQGSITNNSSAGININANSEVDITGGITRTESEYGKLFVGWNYGNYATVNVKSTIEKQNIVNGYNNNGQTINVTDSSAKIKDSTILNNENNTINANADYLTNISSFINNGSLYLVGGTNSNAITGTGKTFIDGIVTNNANIANEITINAEKKLISSASAIDDVINNGTLELTGGTISDSITGTGIISINTGSSLSNVYIHSGTSVDNEINVNSGRLNVDTKDVKNTITAQSSAGVVLKSATDQSQTLSHNISGNGNIFFSTPDGLYEIGQGVSVAGNYISINGADVINNGTLSTNGGDKLVILADSTLTTSADNIVTGTSICNRGTLNLTGGTNSNQIWATIDAGEKILNVNGSVTNTAEIEQETINVNSVLTNNAESSSKITVTNFNLADNAVLNLKDNNISVTNFTTGNSAINFANTLYKTYSFGALTLNGRMNLSINADLDVKNIDKISASSVSGTGDIYVGTINILADTENEIETLNFADSVLKGKVDTRKDAASDRFVYGIVYDKTTGNITFEKKDKDNPINTESSVTSLVGGYVSQTIIAGQVFANADSQVSKIKQANSRQVLYASTANQIFESGNSIERALWLRPFVASETIDVGTDVDNTLYGTLAGIDLPVSEDKMVSVYLGYAGAKQEYDGVNEKIKTNNATYVLGVSGTLAKENYFVSATINAASNKASTDDEFGSCDNDVMSYSVGVKGAYDFDLGKNWTLQPSLMLMYVGVGSNDYTNTQKNKVEQEAFNGFLIEPQIKAKLSLNKGWTPYGLVFVDINSGETKAKVNGSDTKSVKLDPSFEYGVGVDKDFIGSAWSCYGQVTGKSGSRQGVGFNLGVKYAF